MSPRLPRLHQPVQFLGSPQGVGHSVGLSVLRPSQYDQSQGELLREVLLRPELGVIDVFCAGVEKEK